MSLADGPLGDTPYKGLTPYSEEDAPFFFGRDAERDLIIANLMASRFTLLYGASGVGKTSVLRAGAAYRLRRLARENLAERGRPEFGVVVFSAWRDDPIAGLVDHVRRAVDAAVSSPAPAADPPGGSLAEALAAASARLDGDLLVILDQFEEYFLYHADEDGEGTFAVEFPRALNRLDLRAAFLISIREDALAKLDRFEGRIPKVFENYLRIEHLDREAARAAIVKPVEQYNHLSSGGGPPVTLEPALVEAVLDQVKTGRVVLGDAGRGVVEAESGRTEIETPYLQLVMSRLWTEERRAESRVLRLETLNQLGGAERIVRTHLDEVMSTLPPSEQEVAARVFHHLVTPSGSKIAHTVADLAGYVGLPQGDVQPVLGKLSSPEVRILRPIGPPPDRPAVLRYEIFHDVLAPAILDWRARQVQALERADAEARAEEQRLRAEIQAGAARRLRRWALALALVSLVTVTIASYALVERARADRERGRAEHQAALAEATQRRAEEQAALAAMRAEEAEQATRNVERARQDAESAKKDAEDARGAAMAAADREKQGARLTEARRFVEASIENLPVDPELSLLLALRGAAATYSSTRS